MFRKIVSALHLIWDNQEEGAWWKEDFWPPCQADCTGRYWEIGWESVFLKNKSPRSFACTFKSENHKERQRRIKRLGVTRGRPRVFGGTHCPLQNNQGWHSQLVYKVMNKSDLRSSLHGHGNLQRHTHFEKFIERICWVGLGEVASWNWKGGPNRWLMPFLPKVSMLPFIVADAFLSLYLTMKRKMFHYDSMKVTKCKFCIFSTFMSLSFFLKL